MNDFVDWTRIPQNGPNGVHHAIWLNELLCERKKDLEDRHYQTIAIPEVRGRTLPICPVCRAKYYWIQESNRKPRT